MPPHSQNGQTDELVTAETQIELRLQQAICEFLDTGKTLSNLQDISGVASPTLSRYINGERGLSFRNAGLLCTALGLKLGKPAKQHPA